MSRLSDIGVHPYYLLWGRTRDVCVCTTKFLLGASGEFLSKWHPGLHWVVKSLSRSQAAMSVARANLYRRRILSGDTSVLSEAVDFARAYNIRELDVEGTLNSRVIQQALRAVVLRSIGDVYKFYPPGFQDSVKLRNVLVGYKDDGIAVCEESYPGWSECFISGTPVGLPKVSTDKELMELLGIDTSLPCCRFREDSVLLVDGENIAPFELDVFMKSAVPVKVRHKIVIEVFCDQGMKKQWEFVKESSGFKLTVRLSTRVANRKSLVDFDLINEFNRLFYEEGVRDFYVMSSDSDFSVVAKQFPEATVTYVVRGSALGVEWRAKVASAGYHVAFMDESCSYWNYGVFLSAYVVNSALNSSTPVWEHDDLWGEFIEDIGLVPSMKVCDIARDRVRNVVHVQEQKLLAFNKGVMV